MKKIEKVQSQAGWKGEQEYWHVSAAEHPGQSSRSPREGVAAAGPVADPPPVGPRQAELPAAAADEAEAGRAVAGATPPVGRACARRGMAGRTAKPKGGGRCERRVLCSVCGKEGAKKLIIDHIEINHIPGILLPCNICEKTFTNRNRLAVHKSRQHKK